MKVTVKVEPDDGQELSRFTELDAADNPIFWSQGIDIAAKNSLAAVLHMIEAQYGTADHQGVHIIK